MESHKINRIPGMRDLTSDDVGDVSSSASTLCKFLSGHQYQSISTPLLEETELFVRKSGGELTSRLCTFPDPERNQISMRPEFTPSVIRHYVEYGGDSEGIARFQYSGPVVRYDQGEPAVYRQFTQLGAELVGPSGVQADSEILWLAWAGLKEMGLFGCELRIGHVGILHDLVRAYGLSEAAALFIVSNVQAMRAHQVNVNSLMQQAHDIGLIRPGSAASQDTLPTMVGDVVANILEESTQIPFGRRSLRDVANRLLRKIGGTDEPDTFRRALEAIDRLAQLEGNPDIVLKEASSIADPSAMSGLFNDLKKLISQLNKEGIPDGQLVLDLGLAMGISYYTGVIFEIIDTKMPEIPLGSGGRYDGLVKALGGGREVAASGFAYDLDYTVKVIRRNRDNK